MGVANLKLQKVVFFSVLKYYFMQHFELKGYRTKADLFSTESMLNIVTT